MVKQQQQGGRKRLRHEQEVDSETVPDRCERSRQAGREVLTDGLRLEGGGRAALAFTFTVNGGHLDLVGGLGLQAIDGEFGGICQTEDTRQAENVNKSGVIKEARGIADCQRGEAPSLRWFGLLAMSDVT